MLKYRIVFVTLLLVLLLVGCTGEGDSNFVTPTFTPEATATIPPTITPLPPLPTRLDLAYGNLPTTLDPHRTSDQFATTILSFICQGLTSLGRQPLLATDWEYSSDNLSITFNLRQDVQFRDGTPFTSEAVRYSLERLQVPDAEVSPLYDAFQGVQIETPSLYTVVFRFPEPRNDFIDLFTSGYAAIISPSSDESLIASDPICTGPYYIKEWQQNEFILLTKNDLHNSVAPYQENQGPPYIDEIKIHLIATHEERFQALLDGTIDTNNLNTKIELDIIKERSDEFRISQGNWLGGITYLGFNYARPPLNELLVRQALAHAVNKNALIDAVLADEFAIPAVSLLSPGTLGYTENLGDAEYEFDLDASRQLLTEAGFKDENGDGVLERNGEPLQLKLLTTTDNIYLDMATVIQTQFAGIGVAVDIEQATRAQISEITPTGEFDLLLYDYSWPYPSALELFLSSGKIGTTNRVFYSNPEVDSLLVEISSLDSSVDDTIREQMVIEAQRLILKDVPWQPILVRRIVNAVSMHVVGEKMHETGSMLWHDARIEE